MKKIILPFVILTGLLVGCCKAELPDIQIELTDESGNNILSSAKTTDSTWTWYLDEDKPYRPIEIINSGNGSLLSISTDGLNSGQDHYILVDSSDIDTINIVYEVKGYNCNLKSKVEHFYYNGVKFKGGKKGATLRAIK